LMCIAIVQNLVVVYLTPTLKSLVKSARKRGWDGDTCVSLVWGTSLIFLSLICVHGQLFPVAVLSIILMNSLTSCTKAHNRAKLIDSLPHNRVANYMVWDSLNKANQGGIAIAGGQVAQIWGFVGCFRCTFAIMLLRWLVWTCYMCRLHAKEKRDNVEEEDQHEDHHIDFRSTMAGEAPSNLFAPTPTGAPDIAGFSGEDDNDKAPVVITDGLLPMANEPDDGIMTATLGSLLLREDQDSPQKPKPQQPFEFGFGKGEKKS